MFHPQGLLEWKCFFSQCTVASNKNTTSRFHPASVAVFQLCQLCLRGPVHYPLSLYKLYFSMLHLAPSNPQLSLLCYLIKPLLLFPPIATCFWKIFRYTFPIPWVFHIVSFTLYHLYSFRHLHLLEISALFFFFTFCCPPSPPPPDLSKSGAGVFTSLSDIRNETKGNQKTGSLFL